MRTRVLCRVHKTGSTCPGFSHTALMMAMECVKVAGCVAWKSRGSEVARLLKIVNTCVGRYIHAALLEICYSLCFMKRRLVSRSTKTCRYAARFFAIRINAVCMVDDKLVHVNKGANAKVYPGEIGTIGILQAL